MILNFSSLSRKIHCLRSVASASAVLILALAASHSKAEEDYTGSTFGEWHTLCDAALNCAAYTYAGTPGNPKSGHVFNLDRKADTRSWTMSLWLEGVQPNAALGVQASVIRYGYDSDPAPHFTPDDLVVLRDQTDPMVPETYTLFLSGPSAQTVMEHLRPGDILDLEFGGCKDEFLSATFSLKGVTAALAWVDEQQNQDASSSVAPPHPNAAEAAQIFECQN